MSNSNTRKIIVVAGKTGYGKSYFVEHQIIPLLKKAVVFDLQGEYELPGYVVITDVESFKQYIIDNIEEQQIHVVCRFESMQEYEFAFAIAHKAQGFTVVIEEVSNFASPYNMTEQLERLVRFGRHTSTSIVGITQRISDVGPLVLNNADMLVVFNLTDKNDLARLASIGYVGEEGANRVSQLGRYENAYFLNT